jgi:ketosteroid isomerase-like protein
MLLPRVASTVVISTFALLFSLGSAHVAVAQDEERLPSVDLPDDVERVLRDYKAAWEAQDASALAALFAEDGFILRPGHPPVRGRDNIEVAYEGAGGPLHLRAFDYAVEGPVGYVIGGYSSAEGRPDSGKYTLTLRRSGDGRWLIVSDMDNGNRR